VQLLNVLVPKRALNNVVVRNVLVSKRSSGLKVLFFKTCLCS